MEIKFRVLTVFPGVSGVDVQFYTDGFPNQGDKVHVTIYPDPPPTGADLHDYIMSYAPRDWLARMDKIAAEGAPDLSELQSLKDTQTEVVRTLDAKGQVIPEGPKMLAEYNLRQQSMAGLDF